jgi:hypothetical protein
LDSNLSRENLCRTQILISFQDPIDAFLKNPYGNHLIVSYGHIASLIDELMATY